MCLSSLVSVDYKGAHEIDVKVSCGICLHEIECVAYEINAFNELFAGLKYAALPPSQSVEPEDDIVIIKNRFHIQQTTGEDRHECTGKTS